VHLRGTLLGDPQLHGLLDRLDVPVAERLCEQASTVAPALS
jgi:hypothetical protein